MQMIGNVTSRAMVYCIEDTGMKKRATSRNNIAAIIAAKAVYGDRRRRTSLVRRTNVSALSAAEAYQSVCSITLNEWVTYPEVLKGNTSGAQRPRFPHPLKGY